jgi:hypothetical protein
MLRLVLVGLILAATVAFVVGVSIERGAGSAHHDESAEVAPAESADETHAELRPLGADIEAWPFVALAAVASLALAAAAWLNPQRAALLTLVAAVMLAGAALDIREVFHQVDVDEGALAVVAAAVAALHVSAAVVAGVMSSQSRRAPGAPPGTMAA